MIRLGLVGVDEARCHELSRRLRGASLVSTGQISPPANAHCDTESVAFLGAHLPDPALIENLVRAGTDVLLATDAIHPAEILDAATKIATNSGSQFVVINPDRMVPSRRLIFDEIASGKLGVPGLIRAHRWEPVGKCCSSAVDPLPAALMRDLDLAVWLKSATPHVVYATACEGSDFRGDVIQVHLGFADGTMALIDYANTLPTGDGYQSLSVIGSSGAVYADDHPNRQLILSGNVVQAEAADEGLVPVVSLLQSFIDRVSTGAELPDTVPWWRLVHELAAAVRRSLATGTAVAMEGH